MPLLTHHQSSIIGTLFAAAPDAAVRKLELALAEETDQGGPLAEVHALIVRESGARRVRGVVLGPLEPLCRPSDLGDRRFPAPTIARLWNGMRAKRPDLIAQAESACLGLDASHGPANDIYDALCACAAQGLRDGDPAFAAAREALLADGQDGLDLFIAYLDLTPLARQAIERLPEWLGRMSEERAAAARLAYKDAVSVSDEAGPRLIAMLLAQLPQPWLILRVLAAVVIRPNDRYLASSELARFGDYVLDDVTRRLAGLRRFDVDQGRAAGAAAAQDLHVVAQAVAEFETALELSRDGPWAVRVTKLRQNLAELAEARLAQVDKIIDQALPLQLVRFGKGLKGMPKLATDPDPRLLRRAEGIMGFFDHSRTSATSSGFGAMRAKIGEMLEARLDQYVEDLLDVLHTDETVDPDRVHAYLDAAAGFIGDIRGEKAAQIVRRRAAAA